MLLVKGIGLRRFDIDDADRAAAPCRNGDSDFGTHIIEEAHIVGVARHVARPVTPPIDHNMTRDAQSHPCHGQMPIAALIL